MANIIPFASASGLPAFFTDVEDSDLVVHASQSINTISIKGKVFTLNRGEEHTVLMNPKDPDSPATNIALVIVKASPVKSKTFYINGYNEGAEDNKPTCFSNDGKEPDGSIAAPQCKTCAACKHNVFGTARLPGGGFGKGKACSDFVKIVVAAPDSLDDLFLMRVPPASIRNLGDYGNLLSKRKIPYQGVLTKIKFDPEQPTPKLVFEPVGFVDEATYNKAKELSKSEQVTRMIYGMQAAPVTQSVVHKAAAEIVDKAEVANPEPILPKTKTQRTAEDIINHAVAQNPTPAAEVSKPKVVETDGGLESALAGLSFDA
jgi:hypothetical protein